MKKEVLLLLIFIFGVSIVSANESIHDWDKTSSSLDLEVSIKGGVNLVPLSEDYFVDYVTANSHFFPRVSPMQQVVQLTSIPQAIESDDSMQFKWKSPTVNKLSYEINSRVIITNKEDWVKGKVVFPLTSIDDSIKNFSYPTKNIDSDNRDIIKIASEIASGEDDEYVVVYKFGDWISNNVKYDLNTLTADVSQNASWVLKNREGVCDEISTLFIAMCRSVGIPARFVSGVAYTNSQDLNNWGPHAWAEVYFPEYGWVPYDVTYKQFGSIDPTHIALRMSLDSDESSTSFKWKASEMDLQSDKLNIVVSSLDKGPAVSASVSATSEVLRPDIKPGSFTLIQVTVKNLAGYYQVVPVQLSQVEEMAIEGKYDKVVVLAPFEEKRVFWVVSFAPKETMGIKYTVPVDILIKNNIHSKASLVVQESFDFYSSIEMLELLGSLEEGEKLSYSNNIDFSCSPKKAFYYSYEEPVIQCVVTNIGNTFVEKLNVCLKDQCQVVDVGISQKSDLLIGVKEPVVGEKQLLVTAKSSGISKSVSTKLVYYDVPNLTISINNIPSSVSYGQDVTLNFHLVQSSVSVPNKLNAVFVWGEKKEEWSLIEFKGSHEIIVKLNSADFNSGNNSFAIKASYTDFNDRIYETERVVSISMENVSFWNRTKIMFRNLEIWLEGLFL